MSLRKNDRARSYLITALLLSLIIHLVGGGIWGFLTRVFPHIRFAASLQQPPPQHVDTIVLEKPPATPQPTAPPKVVMKVVKPVAPPRPRARRPPPPPPQHELAHIVHQAPSAQVPRAPATIARLTVPHRMKTLTQEGSTSTKPSLTQEKIAQLDAEFAKTIADSHQSLADVQAAGEAQQVVTMKHYTVAFSGLHEGMKAGDGEIYAIKKWRIGNVVWYYTRYTYMHADGTYEADEIPWPFHYPIDDDPFARHDRRIPLQPPPPGYKPDRPLKPILAQYFGGPPTD